MAEAEKLDHIQLLKLETYTLRILVQCLMHRVLNQGGDPKTAASEIADLMQGSVDLFEVSGASPAVASAAKDLMLQWGQEWIAASVTRVDFNRPAKHDPG